MMAVSGVVAGYFPHTADKIGVYFLRLWMPIPELRFRVTPAIMAKLDALQQYWGHRARAGAIESAILEAHDRHLTQTRWEHQKAHACRVLRRAKPGLIFEADEVSDVNFTDYGEWVVVTVGRSSVYKFSRKVWEQ